MTTSDDHGEPAARPAWARLVSTDSDEVSEKMESHMRDVFTPRAIGRSFTYDRAFLATGPVTFMTSPGPSHSAMYSPADPSMVCVGLVTAGVVEAQTSAGKWRVGPAETALLPTASDLTTFNYSSQVDVVNVDVDGIARVAAEFLDRDVSRVRFDTPAPRSSSRVEYWWRTVGYVSKVVSETEVFAASPMVRFEAFRMLCVALLETFPYETVDGDKGRRGHVEPAVIRRAVAFIESHADVPDLDTVAIAAASRVGARALQLGFRRYRGTTPTAYLRQVRLARAHEDLRAGDPSGGDTVTRIAASWGFTSPSYFSSLYREAYGVPPSHTLRQ